MIVAVNKPIVPLNYAIAELDDPYAREETETRERALLCVAVTRAKQSVVITACGRIDSTTDCPNKLHRSCLQEIARLF